LPIFIQILRIIKFNLIIFLVISYIMKNFLLSLLDWIYKKRCYCCSSSSESLPLCSKCYSELEFNPPQVNRIINGVNVYIAGSYEKYLQKIIRGIKYHNKKELAYYQAKFMYEYFKMLNLNKTFQIIPVPLHKNRQTKRKYNHMELVAEEFSKLTGFPINFELIKRIKDTKPQYKLTKQQRIQNLENAFLVDKTKNMNIPILLIDDICTSGTTFQSIITELHKHKIENITCFATTSPFI